MPSTYHHATVHSVVSDVDDPHVFADCSYKVDDRGCLHIFRAPNGGTTVMVAAFGAGSWHLVLTDAQVVERDVDRSVQRGVERGIAHAGRRR